MAEDARNVSSPLGLIPDENPVAESPNKGISVKYVHGDDKHWYVFRASYGREEKAFNFIIEDGTFAYIPKQYVEKTVNSRRKRYLKAIIPNLIFVYTTKQDADRYVKHTPELSFLSYYYNHFAQHEDGKNPPLIIPDGEMENFMLATSNRNKHLLFVQPSQCHFKSGDRVKVTEGDFKGVTGKVARVAGQQRVVITLSGIGLISTAYIPSAFIQPMEQE